MFVKLLTTLLVGGGLFFASQYMEELTDTPVMPATHDAHVVVVGGGLAGLSAVIEAYNGGARRVTLIDKNKSVGGNSAKATSGINACGTPAQAPGADSVALFTKDTLASGGRRSSPVLVNTLTQQSAAAVEFIKSFGVPLTALTQCGGHSTKRTHREPPKEDGSPRPVGFDIVSALKKHILTLDPERIDILTSTTVKALVVRGGEVRGVSYVKTGEAEPGKALTMDVDAVVLTTGGFSYSPTLLDQHAPHLQYIPTTNGPHATGDGLALAANAGVELIDLDQVQVHPTGFVNPNDAMANTKILAPEAVRGCGGVLLNGKGERFVNELGLRDEVTREILAQGIPAEEYAQLFGLPEPAYVAQLKAHEKEPKDKWTPAFAYLVLPKEAAECFGMAAIEFYARKWGLFTKHKDMESFARAQKLPVQAVQKTLQEYNMAMIDGKCTKTGKTVFPPVHFELYGPLWVAVVTPAIHYTMGGARLSSDGSLLRADGTAVGRLFGAGEATGGVHGRNRLAGNSLLECAVFGRIAGGRAAQVNAPHTAMDTKDGAWHSVRVVEEEEKEGGKGVRTRVTVASALQRRGLPGVGTAGRLRRGGVGEWEGTVVKTGPGYFVVESSRRVVLFGVGQEAEWTVMQTDEL